MGRRRAPARRPAAWPPSQPGSPELPVGATRPAYRSRISRARLNRSRARGLVLVHGDERVTFEEFFRDRYGEVVRSMRLMVGDDARAEELAQEAFARACRHWRRVRGLDRPVAWVYVVATNEARRGWRREQRESLGIALTEVTRAVSFIGGISRGR